MNFLPIFVHNWKQGIRFYPDYFDAGIDKLIKLILKILPPLITEQTDGLTTNLRARHRRLLANPKALRLTFPHLDLASQYTF